MFSKISSGVLFNATFEITLQKLSYTLTQDMNLKKLSFSNHETFTIKVFWRVTKNLHSFLLLSSVSFHLKVMVDIVLFYLPIISLSCQSSSFISSSFYFVVPSIRWFTSIIFPVLGCLSLFFLLSIVDSLLNAVRPNVIRWLISSWFSFSPIYT